MRWPAWRDVARYGGIGHLPWGEQVRQFEREVRRPSQSTRETSMSHLPRSRAITALTLTLSLAAAMPAAANNFGESLAWQFMTPGDLAAQTALRDMIERRRGGGYAAPNYTTNIERQYNCSVAATATGNNGTQTALANSPSVTGATSTSTGNGNSAEATGGRTSADIANSQANSGAVGSSVTGGTTTAVNGVAWQALNSSQTNSGNQSASVQNASACAFGVLN